MISSIREPARRPLPLRTPATAVRPPRQVEPLAHGFVTTSVVRLAKGDCLYREGEPPVAPFLVLEGVLRVLVPTATGRTRLADLAGPGDVLATSVFDGTPHAETVTAADAAVVALVDPGETLARCRGRADLSAALVRQLTRSRELADDLGLPMGARICRILSRLADRLGERVEMGSELGAAAEQEWRHLPFSLTHDDVALLAGCARVTATRILGELKEAQVLDGHRGNYALVPAALESAADQYVYDVL